MLSYSVGEDNIKLFVVVCEGLPRVYSLPIGEGRLRSFVDKFHNSLYEQGWLARAASRIKLARRLYDILIGPAESVLQNGDRVVIVPDGPLHLLPFGALIRGSEPVVSSSKADNGHGSDRDWSYFVEWKPLHSVLSATVYAGLQQNRRSVGAGNLPAQVVAFGDPEYSGELGRDYPRLPYARREIERIAGLYPPGVVQIYLGADATEERAKSFDHSISVLHFASHGKFDDRFPLNSFVALTIPMEFSEDRDNGLLHAWEILEHVRLDTDLVVLSACQSGLGKELGGDGLIGLTRAFQYAGARTIAATLWNVADQPTAELMIRFYRHLKAGKTKDAALQAAQIELIHGPIQVQDATGKTLVVDASAPYYWAAFQLIGDWQ